MDKLIVNFEESISIKGIKATGNQISSEKIKNVDLLDPLPYEEPEINDVELIGEEIIDNEIANNPPSESEKFSKDDLEKDDDGQTSLF